ncbi:GL21964 [Drosophila persimilis]|uniref:GL21964 n=1 Tax=Drosophila persimilis TaxID=7234 RepID=B4GE64_DROPE|nr:GL21964 [Drosophila persimilis]
MGKGKVRLLKLLGQTFTSVTSSGRWRSVYLRLKKRHPEDKDAHTLQAGEVEKDLGLESILEAAQGLALEDAEEEEEDGDLTLVVNPQGATEPANHDAECAAADIALVQEPWIATGNSVVGLKSSNHNLFYSTSVSRNRTIVLVRKGIHAYLMSHYSTDDLTVVMLGSEENRLLVASCYMAHDRPAPLRSLVTEAGTKNHQLVIGTDATTMCGEAPTSMTEEHTFVGLGKVKKDSYFEARDSGISEIRGGHREVSRDPFQRVTRPGAWSNLLLTGAYHTSCKPSRTKKRSKPLWWIRDLSLQRNNLREFFKIANKRTKGSSTRNTNSFLGATRRKYAKHNGTREGPSAPTLRKYQKPHGFGSCPLSSLPYKAN